MPNLGQHDQRGCIHDRFSATVKLFAKFLGGLLERRNTEAVKGRQELLPADPGEFRGLVATGSARLIVPRSGPVDLTDTVPRQPARTPAPFSTKSTRPSRGPAYALPGEQRPPKRGTTDCDTTTCTFGISNAAVNRRDSARTAHRVFPIRFHLADAKGNSANENPPRAKKEDKGYVWSVKHAAWLDPLKRENHDLCDALAGCDKDVLSLPEDPSPPNSAHQNPEQVDTCSTEQKAGYVLERRPHASLPNSQSGFSVRHAGTWLNS